MKTCLPIKRKRLFFDIETSFNVGVFWRAGFKLNITPDSIIHERKIICICYKWEGEKKVYSLTWDAKQCDKKMLKDFSKVLNQADEAIGHNGDRYDLSFVRTRCLFHSIPMFPTYVTIDTLKKAKAMFMFNSNKLDYIARFLGVGQKISTGGLGLWKAIVFGKCEKAMLKMVRYCKGDVVILEKVFIKMLPHLPARTHYAVKNGGLKRDCPECSSTETKIIQTRYSAAGVKKVQLQCKSCFKYFTVAGTALKK